MQPVLTTEDVRKAELTLDAQGVSLAELMDRAGTATAQAVLGVEGAQSVAILAGYGNNGGDGWVAATLLQEQGLHACVVTPVLPADIRSDLAREVALAAERAKVPILVLPSQDELDEVLFGADVVVDAMLGTGFYGDPKEPFASWINSANACGAFVLAVDVPSGLSAQTGCASQTTIVANKTVTMICLKPGLLSDLGRDVCGDIEVAPLDEQAECVAIDEGPTAWRCEPGDYLDVMFAPSMTVDKFTRGSVLVVGGSRRYIGAAVLAARAAARGGAGYVTLAVPEPIVPVVQAHVVEIPVVGMPADPQAGCFAAEAVEPLLDLAQRSSAVVVGPGMTVCPSTMAVVQALLGCDVPLVVDADALNCLARIVQGKLDQSPELIRRAFPLVLTPHRRELGRLVDAADAPPQTLPEAIEAARRVVWADGGSELCIVAKGATTACVGVDVALLPQPGPSALATAGSGDVLAGIMGATLARTPLELAEQNLPLLCAMACEVHGYAGSIAAERYGSRGVMAGDVADVVGLAMDLLEERATLVEDKDVWSM
ncbi:MAG: NAD(P)H-hydrate epimerase [Coriobacteriales bacterium]|nr:NAD(P)H-hydrate epimerase [Coriobacteriales bacterium]